MVAGLVTLGLFCGCEETEPGYDVQGRFLSELLRQNEELQAAGDGRWLDPKVCGDSTEFFTRLAHVRGIVATEVPAWAADWEVVACPPAGASAPLAFRRLGRASGGTVEKGCVAVVRRGRTVDVLTPEDFREELKNLFGTTEGLTVGNGL